VPNTRCVHYRLNKISIVLTPSALDQRYWPRKRTDVDVLSSLTTCLLVLKIKTYNKRTVLVGVHW